MPSRSPKPSGDRPRPATRYRGGTAVTISEETSVIRLTVPSANTVGATAARRRPASTGRAAPSADAGEFARLSATYTSGRPDAGDVRRGGGVARVRGQALRVLQGAQQVVVVVRGRRR